MRFLGAKFMADVIPQPRNLPFCSDNRALTNRVNSRMRFLGAKFVADIIPQPKYLTICSSVVGLTNRVNSGIRFLGAKFIADIIPQPKFATACPIYKAPSYAVTPPVIPAPTPAPIIPIAPTLVPAAHLFNSDTYSYAIDSYSDGMILNETGLIAPGGATVWDGTFPIKDITELFNEWGAISNVAALKAMDGRLINCATIYFEVISCPWQYYVPGTTLLSDCIGYYVLEIWDSNNNMLWQGKKPDGNSCDGTYYWVGGMDISPLTITVVKASPSVTTGAVSACNTTNVIPAGTLWPVTPFCGSTLLVEIDGFVVGQTYRYTQGNEGRYVQPQLGSAWGMVICILGLPVGNSFLPQTFTTNQTKYWLTATGDKAGLPVTAIFSPIA